MSRPSLDLVTARRWAVTTRVMLGAARERIDSLNVFPVADGDTGTNMYLTMDGALDFVRSQFELGLGTERLDEGLALIARGMLLAARGNSGVILSQLSRGLADAVGPDVEVAGPEELALAFETAAQTAWDSLAAPVEGTILSVARAAAEGARAAVTRGRPLYDDDVTPATSDLHVVHVVNEALEAARQALARTPEQLRQLRDAGVVDAGGAGLVLVIEALEAVLEERSHLAVSDLPGWWELVPESTGGPVLADAGALASADGCQVGSESEQYGTEHGGTGTGRGGTGTEHGGAGTGHGGAPDEVEVMYLLTGSDSAAADRLRNHLARLGNSVVVAGGPTDFRVHVHLERPRLAVEAGTFAGQVSDVSMTSLDDGSELLAPRAGGDLLAGQEEGVTAAAWTAAEAEWSADELEQATPLGVVACVLGDGIAEVFESAGAQVVASGPRRRASAGQLLAAMLSSRARRVVVLPNDSDTIMVARAAAQEATEEGLVVDVIPTRTLVQGLAALAVLDPDGDPDAVVEAMTQAAEGTRSGALTRADRAADTPVGRCAAGQWLGFVDQAIVAVDDDLVVAASQVLDQLWHDDVELLTVLVGAEEAGADPGTVQTFASLIEDRGARHGGAEVEQVHGGQPTYPFLLGAE